MSWPDPKTILQTLQSPVIFTDSEGIIAGWNDGATRLFGFTQDEMLGKRVWDRFPHEVQTRLIGLATMEEFNEISDFENLERTKRGGSVWVSYHIRPLMPSPKATRQLLITAKDISEYKTILQLQAEESHRLEGLAGCIRDAIIAVDAEQRITVVNKAAEKIFGYHRGHLLRQPISHLPGLQKALEEHQTTEIPHKKRSVQSTRQIQATRANGEIFPAEITISTTMRSGQPVYNLVIHDNSRRKQMEKALQLSQKMQSIGALASGVAHDFNNVLTSVLSHLDLISLVEGVPAKALESVDHARNSGRRGAELINRLQVFSRHTDSKPVVLDVAETIREVIEILRRSIDKSIQIASELLPEDLGMIKGDQGMFLQILMNLCLNARDAMPDGGELSLWAENVNVPPLDAIAPRKPGDFVRLTVQDNGNGIPREEVNRLFEPYFTTKEFGKGTGLGLWIAQNVAQEYGGWIEAESQVGKGSRFQVYFPRCQTGGAGRSAAAKSSTMAVSDSMEGTETILVVDDEELIRMVAKTVLSYRGYKIIEAEGGEQALEVFQQNKESIHLVLLDLHMNQMNGWTVLKKIRELDTAVPIVMMSGGKIEDEMTSPSDFQKVSGYLQKPFENTGLVKKIRQALNSARAARQDQP